MAFTSPVLSVCLSAPEGHKYINANRGDQKEPLARIKRRRPLTESRVPSSSFNHYFQHFAIFQNPFPFSFFFSVMRPVVR